MEEASARVSMPIDVSERDVAENDLQDSPESGVRISDKGSKEHPTPKRTTTTMTRNCDVYLEP